MTTLKYLWVIREVGNKKGCPKNSGENLGPYQRIFKDVDKAITHKIRA